MYANPLNNTGTPYFDSSNSPISRSFGYRSRRIPSTTKFVDVPMSVHAPAQNGTKRQRNEQLATKSYTFYSTFARWES